MKTLNNSKIDKQVIQLLRDLKNNGNKKFYPKTIVRYTKLSYSYVLNNLALIQEEGKIKANYEVVCNNDHINYSVDNYKDILNKNETCSKCKDEFKILFNNIILKYSFK